MRVSEKNSTLAHQWANKIGTGSRGVNMLSDADTIYSYGYHFPIARHFTVKGKNAVIFTLRGYSNTTAKHIGIVRGAVSHLHVINAYKVPDSIKDSSTHSENINHWIMSIESNVKAMGNARKPEKYTQAISAEKAELEAYLTFFGLKLTREQKKLVSIKDITGYLQLADKQEKARKAHEAKVLKDGSKLFGQWLQAWRDDTRTSFNESLTTGQKAILEEYLKVSGYAGGNVAYLRLNYAAPNIPVAVETTKAVIIPVRVAERFYKWYLRVSKAGGCAGNCKGEILGYSVTSANADELIVGCHKIARTEIDEIAKALNW